MGVARYRESTTIEFPPRRLFPCRFSRRVFSRRASKLRIFSTLRRRGCFGDELPWGCFTPDRKNERVELFLGIRLVTGTSQLHVARRKLRYYLAVARSSFLQELQTVAINQTIERRCLSTSARAARSIFNAATA